MVMVKVFVWQKYHLHPGQSLNVFLERHHQFIIDDSKVRIWGRGWGGVCLGCGPVRLGQYKNFGMVLGMVFLPLEDRRILFPDWPWLCDESSPHRRALHIHVQILAGKFKMEFLPTVILN